MMYASFENPHEPGMYETIVCIIELDGGLQSEKYGIGSFYGDSSFADGVPGVVDTPLKNIHVDQWSRENPWTYKSNNSDYDWRNPDLLIF